MRNALLAVVVLAGLSGGAPVAAPQTGQGPVFRSGVELVQVFATVRDATGQPVRGLSVADFKIFDGDHPLNLQVVSEFHGPPFDGPEWLREHSINVAANEPIAERRLVVIVVDDARMALLGSARTRVREIAREVVRNLSSEDLACVLFTATNQGAQDFTADRALLLHAVDSLAGGFGGSNASPLMAAYSVDVLRRAVTTLATVPARRRVLVFVGTGQPIHIQPPGSSRSSIRPIPGGRTIPDQFGVAGRVDSLLQAAQASGTSVYVIDPRAEVRDQGSPVAQFARDLARHTGAVAVIGESDAAKAARTVLADAEHYYVLGFLAEQNVRPGVFRKLRVATSRPELDVRAQTGYYPPKTAIGTAPLTDLPGSPTTAALSGALPSGALPLRMSLTSFATRTDGGAFVGQLAANLEVGRASTSRPSGPVVMELRVFDGEGRREIAVVTDRREIRGNGQLSPLPVVQTRPGRYNVRVALQHPESGLTGSVYGTVTVPDYAEAAFAVSDVFVQAEGAGPDAWRLGLSSVRRTFSRSEKVSLVVDLYGTTRPAVTTAVIEILDPSNAVVHRETIDLKGDALRFQIPLTKLSAGMHFATIAIGDDKASIRRTLVFSVSQ